MTEIKSSCKYRVMGRFAGLGVATAWMLSQQGAPRTSMCLLLAMPFGFYIVGAIEDGRILTAALGETCDKTAVGFTWRIPVACYYWITNGRGVADSIRDFIHAVKAKRSMMIGWYNLLLAKLDPLEMLREMEHYSSSRAFGPVPALEPVSPYGNDKKLL